MKNKREMNKISHYRITKYNPALRDDKGRYLKSDWTSISDDLGISEYLKIESQYCQTVLDCLKLCGIKKVEIESVENKSIFKIAGRKTTISVRDWGLIDLLVRLVLREKTWFKLAGARSFYVHFGYDYYMYIGGPFNLNRAKINGLFIEKIKSPYL